MAQRLSKAILYWSFVFLAFGISGALCRGQDCADSFEEHEFHCESSSCSDDVYVYYPNESQDGVTIECGATDCCGQQFSTCWGEGNCEPLELKKPRVQERLTQLAHTSEVLVADCRGRYGPYVPGPHLVAARRTFKVVDDRILR